MEENQSPSLSLHSVCWTAVTGVRCHRKEKEGVQGRPSPLVPPGAGCRDAPAPGVGGRRLQGRHVGSRLLCVPAILTKGPKLYNNFLKVYKNGGAPACLGAAEGQRAKASLQDREGSRGAPPHVGWSLKFQAPSGQAPGLSEGRAQVCQPEQQAQGRGTRAGLNGQRHPSSQGGRVGRGRVSAAGQGQGSTPVVDRHGPHAPPQPGPAVPAALPALHSPGQHRADPRPSATAG